MHFGPREITKAPSFENMVREVLRKRKLEMTTPPPKAGRTEGRTGSPPAQRGRRDASSVAVWIATLLSEATSRWISGIATLHSTTHCRR